LPFVLGVGREADEKRIVLGEILRERDICAVCLYGALTEKEIIGLRRSYCLNRGEPSVIDTELQLMPALRNSNRVNDVPLPLSPSEESFGQFWRSGAQKKSDCYQVRIRSICLLELPKI